MKFLHTQNTQSLRFTIFSVFLICCVWFFGGTSVASAQDAGDGVYFYGITGNTMPYTKAYDNSANTFSATSTTIASGTAVVSIIKSSPTKKEMVAGYVNASGMLYIVCFDGVTWTNEWAVSIGGTGTTRRFDIGYESDTGDVMVLYSSNTATTNELKFRTKSGSAACGSGNWSSETNLDPVRTTGIVQWVKIAEDKRATSTLMTAIWADANRDLSAMVWSGTAWGNEHTAALETTLEVATAAQDVESFDVVYESLSGDVMVVWGSGGTDGTNGAYYAVCTGGTASCTWTGVRTAMPTFLDDATHISIAADPLSDQIVFASIGNAGADFQRGIWSGSAWTNNANVDITSQAPTAGRMFVATGWLNNGATKRAVITYYDSAATNIGWHTASGTTWTAQTDVTPTTAFGTQTQYEIVINPYNHSELMFTVSNSIQRGFAKRLQMSEEGVFTWTQPDGGILVAGLTSTVYQSANFAFWQSLSTGPVPVSLSGVVYTDTSNTTATTGVNVSLAIEKGPFDAKDLLWTPYSAAGDNDFWYSVTYGNGLFVAVGSTDDLVMTSPDGINWTPRSATGSWLSVTYGNGLFVAVGSDTSAVMTSPDGINWTTQSTPAAGGWRAVTYGNGLFVAVGIAGSIVMTSPDGVHWTQRSAAGDNDFWQGVTYGNGLFVAVGSSGDRVMTSPDGINWTVQSAAGNNDSWTSVTYGNGLFVAAGLSSLGDSIMISADGVEWVPQVTTSGWNAITYGNGLFVAVGNGAPNVMTSPDGINWTPRSAAGSNDTWRGITYGNGLFVAVGSGSEFVMTSGKNNTVYATTTTSGGNWDFSVNPQHFSSTTPLVLFVDGESYTANTLLQGYDSSVSGISLYADTVVVHGASSTSDVVMAHFEFYDDSADGDVMYSVADTEMMVQGPIVVEQGNMIAPPALNLEGGFTNNASFTKGVDVTFSSYVGNFISGLDTDGSGVGTTNFDVNDIAVSGNYLYAAKNSNSTACSQSAGSAIGCELLVFDISDPANPVYVAGRDSNGSTNGTTAVDAFRLHVVGDYLYVGGNFSNTACNGTPGNAIGCELKVYDISIPSNPRLVAGRDGSGSSTGTAFAAIASFASTDGYLFVGKGNDDSAACSQVAGSAAPCEIMVFDISDPTNPTYVAGRDADGAAAGTNGVIVYGLEYHEGYLYVAKDFNNTGCSQSAGSAEGCEIMVFDVTTPTSPTYVAGRDDDGSPTNGDGQSNTVSTLVAHGDYLYVGKFDFFAPACGQTAGSGGGCELTVYDISTPASITYVAGRDANGSASGAVSGHIISLTRIGDVLYGVKSGNATACSPTIGNAAGCELVAFDISSSTNPLLMDARDISGSRNGTVTKDTRTVIASEDALFIATVNNSTACSQVSGETIGCEIVAFNAVPHVHGDVVGANNLGNVSVEAVGVIFNADAEVDDLTISEGFVSAPELLVINGDYTNNSLLYPQTGAIRMAGTNKTIDGFVTGTNAFYGLEVSGSYDFAGAAASTTNLTILPGGELIAPSVLSVERRMHSDGVFDNNTGTVLLGQTDTNIGEYVYGISKKGVVDPVDGAYGDMGMSIMVGKYMYVGVEGYEFPCSQTPDAANECSLLVFDMTDPDVPVLVYSLSGGGSAGGSTGGFIVELLYEGNYVYVGKKGNDTACSQTPGSAVGCEIMVLDVSNPAVPVYVAGRDLSGSSDGTASKEVMSLAFYNNHLYVGTYPDSTACSQTPGSAVGCEIMVFDVTDPTDPTYVAGRDGDASADGTTGPSFEAGTHDVEVVDNYLYVARSADGECYVSAGQAEGCALQIYDITTGSNPTLVGTLTSSGQRTSEFSFSEFRALAVLDNYLYVGKAGEARSCEQGDQKQNCEVQVYDISSSTNPIFVSGMDMSGDPSGGAGYTSGIVDLEVADGYLYVVKLDLHESCLPIAGSATGCYVQIYDIASSTNPVLVSARDTFGTYGVSKDNNRVEPRDIMVYDGRVFVTYFESGTFCSDGIGGFYSCGMSVFETGTAGVVTGQFTGDGSLGDVVTYGTTVIAGVASTTDLTLAGDILNVSPTTLTVGGNLEKVAGDALFSINAALEFISNSAQTVSGTFTDLATLPKLYFAGSGTKTVSDTASTSHVTIAAGAPVTFESLVEVKGAFQNAGTFSAEAGLILSGLYENTGTTDIENELTILGSPIVGLVGGVDGSGQVLGTGREVINDVVINGDYLYTAKRGSGDCASNLSDGSGCHLQVFDVSDPANMLYVHGKANTGGYDFTYGDHAYALATEGSYLYVGRQQNGDTCQNASLQLGCELVVYDISSSTDLVFVAGRDSDGALLGTADNTAVLVLELQSGYLYVGKEGNGTACSQSVGSAVGCEIMVFDVTDPTDPVYVAGVDVSASATGDSAQHVVSIEAMGDYLYVGTEGNDTACSQSAGSAIGCELLVFDVTDPTDPVYVAGRDSDGTSAGTRSAALYSLKGDGTYLYAGYNSDFGDCDETTQETCEVKVYDISSPTTPSLVGGTRGIGRPFNNTAGPAISAIEIYGNILYVGKQPSGTGCNTWMPDTDLGPCELMAFDISSSTNPLYLDARDVSGGGIGSHDFGIYAMALGDGYLYTVIRPQFDSASESPCIPVAGFAEGCDIQAYDLHHTLSGAMTDANAFPDTTITGVGAEFIDNATTRTIVFEAGETIAPATLTVSGDFIHDTNGTFVANGGEVVLNGADQNVVGTTTFFDLTKQAAGAATTTFEAGSLTTVLNDWNFSGASAGVPHVLRSSVDSEYWYINASTTLVSNLAVRDSNNLNVTAIVCGAGCINNTGNVNWSFEEVLELSILSSAPHTFYFGQATTSLGSIVITEGDPATITATDDIRIRIATSTTNFRFDTATTELTFGGTASGKVGTTVSYENDGAVLVIDVTTNFAAGETLVIDGVKVGSFAEASADTSVLALYTNGAITGEPAALDAQPIRILGGLNLEDHPEGQVSNLFGALNVDDEPFFAFSLETVGEETLIEDFTLSLFGVGGITTENILNFRLYRDNNSDRELDGGDLLIDGAGIFTINEQNGAVTFSSNFTASTSADYLIVADTFAIPKGASVNMTLTNTALSGIGSISGITPVIVSTVSSIQHIRANAGSTGGSVGVSRSGGSAPAGASTETGGGSGGGAPAGQTDGENIANETDFYKPTTSGALDNEWTNGANALLSDGNYASAASTNLRQSYSGFPFAIPSGNSIQGIGIKIDASGSTPAGTIDVALTWDNGETYTSGKATPTLVGTDVVYMIGGPADLWGRSWSAADFAPEVFRVRVTATTDSNTLRLDALEVRVYHQTSGGSSGGGSGGGRS